MDGNENQPADVAAEKKPFNSLPELVVPSPGDHGQMRIAEKLCHCMETEARPCLKALSWPSPLLGMLNALFDGGKDLQMSRDAECGGEGHCNAL